LIIKGEQRKVYLNFLANNARTGFTEFAKELIATEQDREQRLLIKNLLKRI